MDEAMFWHDVFVDAFRQYYGVEVIEDSPAKMLRLRTITRCLGVLVQQAIVASRDTYDKADRANVAIAAFEIAFKIAKALELKSDLVQRIVKNTEEIVNADN